MEMDDLRPSVPQQAQRAHASSQGPPHTPGRQLAQVDDRRLSGPDHVAQTIGDHQANVRSKRIKQ